MYDFALVEEVEAVKQRDGEFADEKQWKAAKLVLFDELVEVHREELEHDAHVVPEDEAVEDADHEVPVVLVVLREMLEDADLLARLSSEARIVADDLQGHEAALLVVEALHHLPERALSEQFEELVTIADVVARAHNVVAVAVVERCGNGCGYCWIQLLGKERCLNHAGAGRGYKRQIARRTCSAVPQGGYLIWVRVVSLVTRWSDKVNLGILEDLLLFHQRQVIRVQSQSGSR